MGRLKSDLELQIEALRVQLETANVVNTTLRSLVPQEVQQSAGIAQPPCARFCEINAHKKRDATVARMLREALKTARIVRSDCLLMGAPAGTYKEASNLTATIGQILDHLGASNET